MKALDHTPLMVASKSQYSFIKMLAVKRIINAQDNTLLNGEMDLRTGPNVAPLSLVNIHLKVYHFASFSAGFQ